MVFKILFILMINICNVTAIAFTTSVWVLTKCFQGEITLKVMFCLTLTLLFKSLCECVYIDSIYN